MNDISPDILFWRDYQYYTKADIGSYPQYIDQYPAILHENCPLDSILISDV